MEEILRTIDLVQAGRVASDLILNGVSFHCHLVNPHGTGHTCFMVVDDDPTKALATVERERSRCYDCCAGPCVGPAVLLCRKTNSGTRQVRSQGRQR